MPAYPLAFPTHVAPAEVRVRRIQAQARYDNPLQLSSQVQLRSAARYEIDVTLQPMPADVVTAWLQFLYDLQGSFGTFTINLDPYAPGLAPAPGVRTFRLASGEQDWNSKLATEWGLAFAAIEAL
jgi:hypothetical protein